MSRNSSPCSLSQVHAEIHAVWRIKRFKYASDALCQFHHLRSRISRQRRQRSLMHIRNDHYVAAGVGINVQTDEGTLAAMDEISSAIRVIRRHALSDRMVGGGNQVAENTVFVSRPTRQLLRHSLPLILLVHFRDIGIAPGCPEVIHFLISIAIE